MVDERTVATVRIPRPTRRCGRRAGADGADGADAKIPASLAAGDSAACDALVAATIENPARRSPPTSCASSLRSSGRTASSSSRCGRG